VVKHVSFTVFSLDGKNVDYYEINANSYVESTLGVDMHPIYQHFLPLLPQHANILDAGCGSVRVDN